LKPRCAGARILTLDGGGIRGIVELSVLQALHNAVGLGDFAMRDMFDLIVGTSTGRIPHLRPNVLGLKRLTYFRMIQAASSA
jgi:patatin-like phospholipase/acyl hydrolase